MSKLEVVRDGWNQAAQDREAARRAISTVPAADYEQSGLHSLQRLVAVIPPDPERSLLELGCGDGRVTRHLAGLWQTVYAVDLAEGMLRLLTELDLPGVVPVLSAVTLWPETVRPDDAYSDYVLLHNSKQDVAAIFASLRTIMAAGARFAFQLPVYSAGPSCDPGGWTDVAIWLPAEIESVCRWAGWHLEALHVSEGRFDWACLGEHHDTLHLAVAR